MLRKMRNLIGTLLLVTAIAVTQIPVTDVEAVDSGSASEYQMDGTTLVKYNGTAADVSISNYIERIEAGAFSGNEYVKRVTIGDGVESIGTNAFSECLNLESVSIADSVVSIENAAFSGCPALAGVSVGKGLSSLGNGAFAGDYSLSTVNFDSSNPKFTCDDGAIYNKNGRDTLYQLLAGRKADTYDMPASVTRIKPYAFWGDYNLQNVSISSNVGEISGYAFSNCKNLKNVDIPYSVKSIDMKAFEDCVRMRSITIPPSVSAIHSTAFDGCTKLTINAEPGSYAKNFANSLTLEDIDVSEYEEAPVPWQSSSSVSGNDVAGEDDIPKAPVDYYHEVSHMNAMEEEEDSSVKGKTRVIGQTAIVIVDNASATVNVGDTGEILGGEPENDVEQNFDTVPGLAGSEDAKGGSFPKYTIVDNKVIAAQAYYNDEMTSFIIPEGIERIGEFAFARSALQSITIPNGVEEIGYAAFYHCDNLTNVVIPQSVKEIDVAAFTATPWLKEWKTNGNGDFLIVGDGILLSYKGSGGEVVIPSSVKQIGAEAFKGCGSITGVQIPDSVEIIGEAAFAECGSLAAVTGGGNVREIRDRAFAGCPVSMVRIPASVQKIGLRAFDSTGTGADTDNSVVVFEGESLPKLSFGASATRLYRDTYRDLALKGNKIAVIPEGVTSLEDTVLASSQTGFSGVICKVTKEAADSEQGTLAIVGRQGTGGPAAGESCLIDGASYVLEEADENLVSTERADNAAGSGIAVKNRCYSIPQDGILTAVMEGNEENYLLDITDSEEAKAAISEEYKKLYGSKLPHNLCAYEITMVETDTGLPITSLGRQSVEVTIPLPNGVGGENLHVVCLDADGQLEEVSSRIVSQDGMDALTFTARHFSFYGIYNYSSGNAVVADVKDGQAVFASLGRKDDSPNTGDNSIHPKWFFAAGLLFASAAVFFYRGGKRTRRGIRRM